MDFDQVWQQLHDAVAHFNRKREYGELTALEQSHINYELKFAFGMMLDREYTQAHYYINRGNAHMNATAH